MIRCLAILTWAALAAGCGQPTASPVEQAEPFAQTNQKLSRLRAEVQLRDARIKELQKREDQLSDRLSQCEFTNKQLRLRLKAVGLAPMQRDRFKKLSQQQAVEIHRLQEQLRLLNARLRPGAGHRPSAGAGGSRPPTTRAAGGDNRRERRHGSERP